MNSSPRLLAISRHSWRKHALHITDDANELLYTASWHVGFPTGLWTLKHKGQNIGTMRRRFFAPLRTMDVNLSGHQFTIRRRLAIFRINEINGGPFDGATLTGRLTDLDFRIQHRGAAIAEASSKLLSLKGQHLVRLAAVDDPFAEIMTAVMMIDLLIQKHDEF